MWPSGPELVQTPSNVAQDLLLNQKPFTMLLVYGKVNELKTVRFNNSYSCISIHELAEELHIQEELHDDLEEALKHLIDFSAYEINFPCEVPKNVAISYVDHFNTCLDDVLKKSIDLYDTSLNERWRTEVLPWVQREYEQDNIADKPARRESFNNWVDSLDLHPRIKDDVCLSDLNEII